MFIFHESEIVAILPLAQRKIKLEDGLLKVKGITLCGTIELYPDHLDIICASEDNAALYIKKVFNFLKYEYREWDILQLTYIAGGGNLASWSQFKNISKIWFVILFHI